MKRYYAAAILAIALLATGCFKQDLSDCDFPENLVLKLDLRDGNGASLLADKIHSIDAVVYDADNRYVDHRHVVKEAGGQFPAISLTVAPGEYRVVCWGNIGDNTRSVGIREKLPLGESYLETISGTTGCPLYYAPFKDPTDRPDPIVARAGDEGIDYEPYKVIVPPNKVTVKEVWFRRAHRTVNVYLKDYETAYEAAAPKVKINNIPMRSDFLLRTGPSRKNFETACAGVTTDDGDRLVASFNGLITPFANDMHIEVFKASDGAQVTTIDLKQYVESNQANIKDIDEINIEVVFQRDGGVYIQLPTWQNDPLNPEW